MGTNTPGPTAPVSAGHAHMVPGALRLQHKGRSYYVTARRVARYAWTTVSIDVHSEGRCVLATGGQPAAVGAVSSWFTDEEGATHRLKLSWGMVEGTQFPCMLELDGDELPPFRIGVPGPAVGLWLLLALLGTLVATAAYIVTRF